MNGEQAARLQQLLEEACDHFIDDGGRVITKRFTNEEGGQCPLSCLLGKINAVDMARELTQILDTTITDEELWAFIAAFDGVSTIEYQKKYVSMLLIGKALREKYVGVPA